AAAPPLLRRPRIEVLLFHLASPSPPHHPFLFLNDSLAPFLFLQDAKIYGGEDALTPLPCACPSQLASQPAPHRPSCPASLPRPPPDPRPSERQVRVRVRAPIPSETVPFSAACDL